LDDPASNEELPRHVAALRDSGASVIHLSPHALGAPEISVDNQAGIASMVAALVALGHRRIAFLAGPSALYVARERLAGYRRGLADAGIAVDERLIIDTGFSAEAGARAVDDLLERTRSRAPTSRPSCAPTTCSRWAVSSGSTSMASMFPPTFP
jgi:LacI family transcriptional regulator